MSADERRTVDYRSYVGTADHYDISAAIQFSLLTYGLGLRDHHFLLDVGCGSLRAGRLFIPYLQAGHYHGIEPEGWLIEEGIGRELGEDILRVKSPVFSNDDSFNLSVFGRKFDFILAQSIFSHAPEWQIRKCLSEARRVMQPAGVFVATFFEGEESYTGTDWVYPSRVTYTPARMKELVEEEGLVCRSVDWPHPHLQTWLKILRPGAGDTSASPTGTTSMVGNNHKLRFCRQRLRECRTRLIQIEAHPYVRLGLRVRQALKRIASAISP